MEARAGFIALAFLKTYWKAPRDTASALAWSLSKSLFGVTDKIENTYANFSWITVSHNVHFPKNVFSVAFSIEC